MTLMQSARDLAPLPAILDHVGGPA